jgi:hypothetical protein
MPSNVTAELLVKLVITQTLHRIHETGVKRNPVTNLTGVKSAVIQANLKAAVSQTGPPVDKLESVSALGKILDMLVTSNIFTSILRATTHRILRAGAIHEFLPHRIRLTIRIGDTKALFRRIV